MQTLSSGLPWLKRAADQVLSLADGNAAQLPVPGEQEIISRGWELEQVEFISYVPLLTIHRSVFY